MKLKIVVKVQMNCEKCRTKALQVVAKVDGVDFMGIEGPEKDKVVVIGNGVDPVKVTKSLRKVGRAEIVSVEEVKPKSAQDKKKEEDKKKAEEDKKKAEEKKKAADDKKPIPCYCQYPCYQYPCYQHPHQWMYITY